ncbi:LxmA leader domain family RiPP [Crossiella sp. SN42]|uniref:LxmA leader domain family RiPP n=1 Tax=Crossiella sp. SN42 TaxID=2944808 RepID=UPI00207C7628|nr:LxmA leader domain family RiPP [Crossiella sp. SN42]MCO1580506.1 LxmA leader domain family RiPP [Crossiella sp. SN42]
MINTQQMMSGFGSYVDVEELNVAAATDAPATTPICFAAATSSMACLAATSSGWCLAGAGAATGAGAAASVKAGC